MKAAGRMLLISLLGLASPALAQPPAGEEPVAPYDVKDANAGGTPIADPRVFAAFHGLEGVRRIVAETLRQGLADPSISDIFKSADMVRLNRTLTEQICYLLGGPCQYSGRDMATAHKDMGLQTADMNRLVERLQDAMDKEGVPFADQNKLLAKLAPMKRVIVER